MLLELGTDGGICARILSKELIRCLHSYVLEGETFILTDLNQSQMRTK